MTIELADRVRQLQPSATLAVAAKARALRSEGIDVIGLGTGEPDFDTPQHIKDAAVAAMVAGDTKYTAVDGTAALKQAVIDKFQRDQGLEYQASEVLVANGAKHVLFNLFQALLNDGDEVVLPAPYWVSYPEMVRLCGGEAVRINAGIEQAFKITPRELRGALSDRTRLVVLNSPSNPTGQAYTSAELEALAEVLEEFPRVLVATDDIYEKIYWGDEPFCSWVQAVPALKQRGLVINGVSKAYAMTGWRIGYVAGPEPLITAMRKIQSQSTSNPCSIAQAAAVAALAGDQQAVTEMREAFQRRHANVLARLQAIDGVECIGAQGAFYLFPKLVDVIERRGVAGDTALAELMLEEAKVALVPGTAFGAPGHLRISFATDQATLDKALDRIEAFCAT